MYACTYVHIYTYTYTYIHIHTYEYIYIHIPEAKLLNPGILNPKT